MENKKKKIFISTPIYYPNDKLHIGHAYTTVLADYLSRYKKLDNYNVYFVTGSDEHGQKIEDRAKEENISPKKFVDNIIENFKLLWNLLDVNYSNFIRTTNPIHEEKVRNIFNELLNKDLIYKGQYSGWYCKSDESFFTEHQLKDGKCPECGREVKLINEDTHFLKVSEFSNWIKDVLLNTKLLTPDHRNKELVNNFLNDLKDLSVTRNTFTWGIKVNENSNDIIYVWLDALINYISTFLIENKSDDIIWNEEDVWGENSNVEIIQFVGKEITRFHAIYWPILLKMLNYRMPKVFAHGWIITKDGDKMSKSKGNVIDPINLINEYGSDSLRFFLTLNIKTGEDGYFSNEDFINSINGILVNKYSNLISRTLKMLETQYNSVVPKISKINNEDISNKTNDVINFGNETLKHYKTLNDNLMFSEAIKEVIKYIEKLNLYVDLTQPWKLNSSNDELSLIINTLITGFWNVSVLLSPLLPKAKIEVENIYNEKIIDFIESYNKSFENRKIIISKHLFERIK